MNIKGNKIILKGNVKLRGHKLLILGYVIIDSSNCFLSKLIQLKAQFLDIMTYAIYISVAEWNNRTGSRCYIILY